MVHFLLSKSDFYFYFSFLDRESVLQVPFKGSALDCSAKHFDIRCTGVSEEGVSMEETPEASMVCTFSQV